MFKERTKEWASWRTLAATALATTAVVLLTTFAGAPAQAAAKLLFVEGEIEGEIFESSSMFLAQSYSAPIDGMLAVQSINNKTVRIVGSYSYETEVDVVWSFPFSRWEMILPFRTLYEVEVDLISAKGVLNGKPTYRNPTGSVITKTTMHFWGASYTTNETKTLPTIVIETPQFGWNKTWSLVTPIDESVSGSTERLIHLEGAAPGH